MNSDVHMDEISRFICFLRRVRRGGVGVVGGRKRDVREREREGVRVCSVCGYSNCSADALSNPTPLLCFARSEIVLGASSL